MKSLFFRVLVSMWLAVALLVGVFAMIHAWVFPSVMGQLRPSSEVRTATLRAELALACLRHAEPRCEARLAPASERQSRLAIYEGDRLILGAPIEGAEALIDQARAAPEQRATDTSGSDRSAAVLEDPAYVVVAEGGARSRWMFFLVPETLVYRIGAIILISGLVSILLARYIARPLGVLRSATQAMAAGDLSVRVASQLRSADAETLALGADMDQMAERLEALIEAHRRLLRDVSHELRSPLARLGIALELVRRRSPSDVEPAFARIERETERLNDMIGELLALSRLEAGNSLGATERIDLTALVEDLVEDAGFEAEQHERSVAFDAPARCHIEGNPELIRRAIENVVRNAIRFTEPGSSVTVTLEARQGAAHLKVRDRGPGVPEEALSRLFEPFYRVDTDRARSKGGTGIGLAITDRAVTLHGGKVAASNAKGGGLEVSIELPLAGSESPR